MKLFKKMERIWVYGSSEGGVFTKRPNEPLESLKEVRYYRDKDGYKMCSIGPVHRIICTLYHENPENKPQVNHKDGDKWNSHPDNVEWATDKENKDHAFLNGLNTSKKLSDVQVLEIIEKYNTGKYSSRLLGKEYGVCDRMIMRYVKGVDRSHLGTSDMGVRVVAGRKKKDRTELLAKINESRLKGMSYSEISVITGVSESVIKNVMWEYRSKQGVDK